jgi:outer membrane biosynthesis protein TonB
MKRILISLIVLSIAVLAGTAQAANETASKPADKQVQKHTGTKQDAPCPEDPPPRKDLKKKSTTKKVEPVEPVKKSSP